VGTALSLGLKERHSVEIISMVNDRNNKGCDIISTDWFYNPFKLNDNVKRIVKKYTNNNFDLIICAIEPFLPLAARLKKKLEIKHFIFIGHGTYSYFPFMDFPYSIYNRYFAKAIDLMIVPSEFTLGKVKQWFKGNVDVIPWGVDCQKYYPIEGIVKENHFVFVGEQKERKGITVLLLAYEKLRQDHPESKLYVVGKKNNIFVERVKEMALENHVIFTGQLSHKELLEMYSKCLCLVLPSVNTERSFEGYGLVHLEANACGIPSIGSRGTANAEVIDENLSGFTCRQKDIVDIYEKMTMILESTEKEKMSSDALKYAKDHGWNKVIKALEDKIESKFIL